jgi:hypothetical protein
MLEQPRNRIKGEARMREIQDDQGRRWQAVAIPETVAHMRSGAVLGFRDANADGSEPDPRARDVQQRRGGGARHRQHERVGAEAAPQLGADRGWGRVGEYGGPEPLGELRKRSSGERAVFAQAIVTRRAETRRQFRGAPFAQARLYRAYANRARWPRSGHAPERLLPTPPRPFMRRRPRAAAVRSRRRLPRAESRHRPGPWAAGWRPPAPRRARASAAAGS